MYTVNDVNKISFHILRIGLAVTFLWIGVLILRNPEAWGGYMRPWAAGLLPVPVTQVMIGTAILDIVIGVFLLINFLPRLTAIVGTIHLAVILIVSGITDITVRDIGLLAGMLALVVDSPPQPITDKIINLDK